MGHRRFCHATHGRTHLRAAQNHRAAARLRQFGRFLADLLHDLLRRLGRHRIGCPTLGTFDVAVDQVFQARIERDLIQVG